MDIDYQAILDKYHLEKLESAVKLSGGIINPAFLINNKYVLRLESQKYESNPNKFKKEAFLFSVLPKHGIPTPTVVAFDESLILVNSPYLLLEYIQGQDIAKTWNGLTLAKQLKLAFELGVLTKKIHALSPQDINHHPLLSNLSAWLKKSQSDFDKYWAVVKKTDYLSHKVKQEIDYTQTLFKNLDIRQERLVHGDLFTAGNIQIRDGQIVGLFDFEYSQFADPLWDLQKMPLAFQLTPKFNQPAFLKGYGTSKFSKEAEIRFKMYCFHQGVWEIWAVITQFMPFGSKELTEAKLLINNTVTFNLLG